MTYYTGEVIKQNYWAKVNRGSGSLGLRGKLLSHISSMLFPPFEKEVKISNFLQVTGGIHILIRLIFIHAYYPNTIYSSGISFSVNVITTQLAAQARNCALALDSLS